MSMRRAWALSLSLLLLIPGRSYGDASDRIVDYLERYNKLSDKDEDGRMRLAEWCRINDLHQQQADLLTEVLKLHPGHPVAYRELLEADQKRFRPVDKQWAEKLEGLLASRYKLFHSAHFTVLSDSDEESSQMQADAMENTYQIFYQYCASIGLRPMPPDKRLVCILFEHFDDYKDFLKQYEGLENAWSAGHYSWRTNRTAFFHDRDNPVFKDVREKIASLEAQIKSLHEDMENLSSGDTARRLTIQNQLKRANFALADITGRLNYAGKLSTLSKTRHEATHQLLFNSGIQKRGQSYPFWLAEGLAMLFESVDGDGHAAPNLVNQYRLTTYRNLLRDHAAISLPDLMREQPGDNDPAEQVAGRYSQAWLLAHYLWNKHPARFAAYLRAMNESDKPDWARLFATYFGDDMGAVEAALKSYADSL